MELVADAGAGVDASELVGLLPAADRKAASRELVRLERKGLMCRATVWCLTEEGAALIEALKVIRRAFPGKGNHGKAGANGAAEPEPAG